MADEVLDLRRCLADYRQGNEQAGHDLLQGLYPLVIKIVRSHLPRRTAEEDLAQSIFIKVFTHLEQYSGQVPIEHWVSRIAVNTCLNEIQREKVRPELRLADLSEEQEEVVCNLAADEESFDSTDDLASRELVERMLEQLDPEDRLVITLLHLEGRSVEEIRVITGWSKPLVKVRAFRARRRLKKNLERLLQENRP